MIYAMGLSLKYCILYIHNITDICDVQQKTNVAHAGFLKTFQVGYPAKLEITRISGYINQCLTVLLSIE